MKKVLFLLPILAITLTGCFNTKTDELTEKSISCTLSTNDVVNGYQLNSTYKINYTGDFVKSVETEEVVTSENETIIDTFEETLNNTYKKTNEAYGGYDYKVTRETGKVTSKVFIDYSKMNLEQFIKDQPSLSSYSKDNKLLVEGIKQMYTSLGAKCE